jgi:hypothetical protein
MDNGGIGPRTKPDGSSSIRKRVDKFTGKFIKPAKGKDGDKKPWSKESSEKKPWTRESGENKPYGKDMGDKKPW